MKRLLNFGVSNPLTLGMAHPIADRLETLGRARPTSRTSRTLALSAISAIAFASAPLSIAADETKAEPRYTVSIVPDMSETQLVELQNKLDAVSSGQADESVVVDFMEKNTARLSASFDAEDKMTEMITSIGQGRTQEALNSMDELLERCKIEKSGSIFVGRTNLSSGPASVECVELGVLETETGSEIEKAEAEIAVLMASNEFDTATKMAKARGTMAGALGRKNKREFPNPTPQEAYDNCLERVDYLNRFYRYETQEYDPEGAAWSCASEKPQ